jgi:hypothetical protein
MDRDIITDSDPTTFQSLQSIGQGIRSMFDRRADAFVELQAYLFDAKFSDGLSAEVQVNPEFGSIKAARVEAEKYAIVIGRIPKALRTSVSTVWIHKGVEPFGGGNNNLLIHVRWTRTMPPQPGGFRPRSKMTISFPCTPVTLPRART